MPCQSRLAEWTPVIRTRLPLLSHPQATVLALWDVEASGDELIEERFQQWNHTLTSSLDQDTYATDHRLALTHGPLAHTNVVGQDRRPLLNRQRYRHDIGV